MAWLLLFLRSVLFLRALPTLPTLPAFPTLVTLDALPGSAPVLDLATLSSHVEEFLKARGVVQVDVFFFVNAVLFDCAVMVTLSVILQIRSRVMVKSRSVVVKK